MYAPSLLLVLWAIAAAFGCNFATIGILVLVACVGLGVYELTERYRDE